MMLIPFKVRTAILPNDIKAIGYEFSSEEMEAQLANKTYTVVAIDDTICYIGHYTEQYGIRVGNGEKLFVKIVYDDALDATGTVGAYSISGKLFLLYRPNEQPIWWHEKYVIGADEKESATS